MTGLPFKLKNIPFSALLFVFISLRLVPIFTGVERISHYDELETGAIAQDFMRGIRLPLWHYQMDPYGGESLLLGALAVPFVKTMGSTLLAVKMPTLAFAVLLFILTFIFMQRNFGLSPAVRSALLLIFAPAAFVQLSLSGLTGHTESLAFTMGALLCFYDFLYGSRKIISIFLFGLISGLGFWIYHETIVMTMACVLSWYFMDRRSLPRAFLLFLAGFALGASPWIALNLYYGSAGLEGTASKFSWVVRTSFYFKNLFMKTLSFFSTGLPFSFAFFPAARISERFLSALYFLTGWAPVFFLLARNAGNPVKKILPFIFFVPLFFIIFLLSPYDLAADIGYTGVRYLAPLQLVMVLLAVLLPAPETFRKIILCLMAGLGLLSQTALMFKEPPARAAEYSGTSYYHVGPQWFLTLPPAVQTPAQLSAELEGRDAVSNFFLLWGIADTAADSGSPFFVSEMPAFSPDPAGTIPGLPAHPFILEWSGSIQKNLDGFERAAEAVPLSARPFFYKGYLENQTAYLLSECPGCIEKLSGKSDWAWRAAGRHFYLLLEAEMKAGVFTDTAITDILKKIDALHLTAETRKLFFQGFAIGSLRVCRDSNQIPGRQVHKLTARLAGDDLSAFYWGLGWNARAVFREDWKRALDWLNTFPAEKQKDALEGFSYFETWYRIPARGVLDAPK